MAKDDKNKEVTEQNGYEVTTTKQGNVYVSTRSKGGHRKGH